MAPDPLTSTRADSRPHILETITPGGWSKASLHVVMHEGRRAVLKDFSSKSLPVRWIGRLQIAREARAYRRLPGVPGVPAFYGRQGGLALLMEEIRGRALPRFRLRAEPERAALLAQLTETMQAVHARGVVHNDARGQDNALVSDTGRVYLLDYAGSICMLPGGLMHRLFFGLAQRADRAALDKWKAIMHPEALTTEERKRLRRYARWRRLWIFNPKGWGRGASVERALDEEGKAPRRG